MEAKSVRTKISLYIRSKPNRLSNGVLVPAGTTLKYIEIVKGELVEGIDDWYKDEKGNYFWAGGVEKVENNDEVKFIWPLENSYKRITTQFSEKWILNLKKNHTGVDIAAPVGASVFAAADGIVKKVGYLDADRKMAQYIDIEHNLLNYCTAYLHINPTLKIGDKIKARDIVGSIAQLIDMGAHLHFNTWKGDYIDPITHRGALPSIENVGKAEPKLDPAFPSNFVDPMSLIYS